jgi:hypothetical protein
LVGAYGTKLAIIMQDKLGGAAPMWFDSPGGYGGQLAISVNEQKWDFEDPQLKAFDQKGLNPIIINPDSGTPMAYSQRTTQDPNVVTDWSYLGHQMAFDLFRREVRDRVMKAQIGKHINDFYFDIRQKQVQAILNKRIGGAQPIWTAGRVLIKEVNNDTSKAQNKFRISVRVKVTTYAEEVELNFTNIDQFTEV